MSIAASVTVLVFHSAQTGHQYETDQDGEQFQQIVMFVVPFVDQYFEEGDVQEGADRQTAEEHNCDVPCYRMRPRLHDGHPDAGADRRHERYQNDRNDDQDQLMRVGSRQLNAG